MANDICRSAVPDPKYLPERRSTAFPHHYTPALQGQFTTQIVQLCVQHDAREAARRAGPSATADSCFCIVLSGQVVDFVTEAVSYAFNHV